MKIGIRIILLILLPMYVSARVITLDQAYDATLRSDQSILTAYWEIRKANLQPWSALTALSPTISGTITGTRNGQTTDLGDVRTSTRTDSGTLGISLQQTIFDLTVLPAYRQGKITVQSARLTYRSTIREILFGLTQAYYEVLRQQRIVAVYRETLQLAEQQFDIAQKRSVAGEALRSDVLSAQVTVESDRQLLIEAENSLESDRNKLANILNLPNDVAYEVVEPAAYATSQAGFETLLATALQRREDLRVKALAIESSIQERKGVIGEYGPKVVAQVNGDYGRDSGSSGSSRSSSWDANLSVQLPFFTGGQRELDLKNAGFLIKQAQLDYETQSETVQQDVKDAWLDVRTLAASLESLRVQVASAQQAYEDVQSQYKSGESTSVDVLNALNSLNISRRDLATKTYDYQIALRKIEQVIGTFQEERVNQLKFK